MGSQWIIETYSGRLSDCETEFCGFEVPRENQFSQDNKYIPTRMCSGIPIDHLQSSYISTQLIKY